MAAGSIGYNNPVERDVEIAGEVIDGKFYVSVLSAGGGTVGHAETAVEPGDAVAVATTSTPVFAASALEGARYWWAYNNSDTTIWVRYAGTGAAVSAGKPILPGGYLEERDYFGDVTAIHAGAGSKELVVGAV